MLYQLSYVSISRFQTRITEQTQPIAEARRASRRGEQYAEALSPSYRQREVAIFKEFQFFENKNVLSFFLNGRVRLDSKFWIKKTPLAFQQGEFAFQFHFLGKLLILDKSRHLEPLITYW